MGIACLPSRASVGKGQELDAGPLGPLVCKTLSKQQLGDATANKAKKAKKANKANKAKHGRRRPSRLALLLGGAATMPAAERRPGPPASSLARRRDSPRYPAGY